MKVAIIGSRTINDYQMLLAAVKESEFHITGIVSGGAPGVDRMAERYAKEHQIPIEVFKAEWKRYGQSAGMRRNVDIIKTSEAVIALWDGKSRGTRNSINLATKHRRQIFIKTI